MDNPAQVADLTARGWSGSDVVGQTRLDEAWRALRREVPGLEASISSTALDIEDVIDVICAAALRVLRNPEGATKRAVSVDDASVDVTLADSTQDLYFTAAELRRLNVADPLAGGWSGSLKYC